jgi:hypothetical protein
MYSAFTPSGNSIILSYADDSTDTGIAIRGATAYMIYNPDAANVIVFNTSADPDDINAIVPTNEQNGQGVVIGPLQQVIVGLGWPQFSPNDVYIAVAGVSGSGNVYITPGSV